MDREKDRLVLIGGDLNAWTGKLGGGQWNEEMNMYKRESKHKEIDGERKKLL